MTNVQQASIYSVHVTLFSEYLVGREHSIFQCCDHFTAHDWPSDAFQFENTLKQHRTDILCIQSQNKQKILTLLSEVDDLIKSDLTLFIICRTKDKAFIKQCYENEVNHIFMSLDGDDYLMYHLRLRVKELHESKLIKNKLELLSSINNEDTLFELIHKDSLTGLFNRRHLLDYAQDLIINQKDQSFSLLFLDLDGFKKVNDLLGHATGDLLLIEITEHLKELCEENYFIARLGGDEFCIVIVHQQSSDEPEQIAQKIIDTFKHNVFLKQYKTHTSFSIGIATYPQNGQTLSALFKAADTAMYEAKAHGKNCYKLFTSEMSAKSLAKLALEKELLQAIEKQQFEMYYQPQVNLRTQQLEGVEALIRWIHPKKGLVPPDVFIETLEETRLIIEVGEWVLNRACLEAQKLHEIDVKVSVAVNVSPVQLEEENFFQIVENALHNSGLKAQFLELEITESSFQISQDNIDVFKQLRAIGVQIAIDDFGTGFSNLSSLNVLPVDILKVDKSFIDEIPHNQSSVAITGTIISLAHIKRLKIIAEGIESVEQIQYLQAVNCDIGQGYYIGRPMEFAQIKLCLKRDLKQPIVSFN